MLRLRLNEFESISIYVGVGANVWISNEILEGRGRAKGGGG